MHTLADVISSLEAWAPKSLQEAYDNSGLICGHPSWPVKGVMVALDSTEEVVEEAVRKGCNVVVAHHPIVFSGLKSLTGKNYMERTVLRAIKEDVALYAIHTNLDNVATGVNHSIGKRLGLAQLQILAPKAQQVLKLCFYTPKADSERVLEAVFAAGAGQLGEYAECAFRTEGRGSFKGSENSRPAIGQQGRREYVDEIKSELILPKHLLARVLVALNDAHPYEEVAYDIYQLENSQHLIGAGMIGEFGEAISEEAFLGQLRQVFGTPCIRHTKQLHQPIKRVAICGGSGAFLIRAAKQQGADAYVTADIKYHEFFDADGQMLLCDVGHFESEQFTIDALHSFISNLFPSFVVYSSQTETNPINYYF